LRRRYANPPRQLVLCSLGRSIGSFVDSAQSNPRQFERAPGGLDQREVEVVFTNVYPGDSAAGGETAAVDLPAYSSRYSRIPPITFLT